MQLGFKVGADGFLKERRAGLSLTAPVKQARFEHVRETGLCICVCDGMFSNFMTERTAEDDGGSETPPFKQGSQHRLSKLAKPPSHKSQIQRDARSVQERMYVAVIDNVSGSMAHKVALRGGERRWRRRCKALFIGDDAVLEEYSERMSDIIEALEV